MPVTVARRRAVGVDAEQTQLAFRPPRWAVRPPGRRGVDCYDVGPELVERRPELVDTDAPPRVEDPQRLVELHEVEAASHRDVHPECAHV